MVKFSSWARVLITWVVLSADLLISYIYLRNPSSRLEMISLALNFVATTAIYYTYMNMAGDEAYEEPEEGAKEASRSEETSTEQPVSLYKLTFGPLIEDMGVWLVLFFLLYNIVPLTLFVHNWVLKNIQF